MNPQYPVYIISKGRWETRLTASALEEMRVPYHIVVEPQEYRRYADVIDPQKIYQLPFSKLGLGSIPARNWVWEHALSIGAARHWILDDNIGGFVRLNRNSKIKVASGTIFKAAEDFVDRYENVAIAGFHYDFLAKRKQKLPPFYKNRRVYSCILIRNDIPYRWRGRYNEDTDLSLCALKDGWCTILFLAFLACKTATMTMKGGNTNHLYTEAMSHKAAAKLIATHGKDEVLDKFKDKFKDDGRFKMAQSLVKQHPDVATISWKFGRWQHQVDYSPFKRNQLRLKDGIAIPDGINNYGMVLRDITKAAGQGHQSTV